MKKAIIVSMFISSLSLNVFAQVSQSNGEVREISGSRIVMVPMNGNQGLTLKVEDEVSIANLEKKSLYSKGIFNVVGKNPVVDNVLLDGYAKELPLIEVLKQILPEGWKATALKSANVNQKVSWSGGQTWDKTLEKLTVDNGLYIILNWNEKTVKVLDNSQLEFLHRRNEKVAVIDFGNGTGNVNSVGGVSPVVSSVNQSWNIISGSLKENLEIWAEKGKFKLIYQDQVANYNLDAFTVDSNVLDGEDGALSKLASYFSEGKVKQPLDFDYKTGGKQPVLVIKNRNYEQKFFKENSKVAMETE